MSGSNFPDWLNFEETKVKAVVLRYLQTVGWNVKKQTFYNHCNRGKLSVNRAGVYTKHAVKKYTEAEWVHDSVGVKTDVANVSLMTEKTQKEIVRIDTVTKHEQFKLDIAKGKYILRSDFDAELASRAVVLDNGFEYMFQSCAADIIALVGGDQQRSSELLEYLLEKKDERINEYANMDRFRVIFAPGQLDEGENHG